MIPLRPYQKEAIDQIRRAYYDGAKSVLYQLPTGGGKSLIFCYVAMETAARKRSVIIVVHRRELLMQASATLRELQVPHGIIAPGYPKVWMPVMVASVQTLTRRTGTLQPPGLLVVDEAHHGTAPSYSRLTDAWPTARVLGVTATPSRLDGRGLGEVFQSLITGPSMKSLVADGYLAPTLVYAPRKVVDLSNIRRIAGDLDRKEAAIRMDRGTVTGDALDHYKRLAPGKRGIAFCTTLKHAAHVTEQFNQGGVPAEQIDGTLDTDTRDAVVDRFRSGRTQVLVSVALIEEGFDCPEAEVAILLRPTESDRVYLQQVGRIMRPSPGKTHGIVLDHVGVVESMGLPDSDRRWSLEGKKRSQKDPVPPMSRCPECFACFPPSEVCPACNLALPKRERRPMQQVDGDLVLVTDGLAGTMEQIAKTAHEKRMEEVACQTLEDWRALGRKRGYAPGWAWVRWNARRRRRGVAV